MSKKKDNRHGRHREELVQFGGMVEPEFKALAQLTASVCRCTLVDLMRTGVETIATSKGIMSNGQVLPEYEESIRALASVIRSKLNAKREGV